jgi:hypothetical protein
MTAPGAYDSVIKLEPSAASLSETLRAYASLDATATGRKGFRHGGAREKRTECCADGEIEPVSFRCNRCHRPVDQHGRILKWQLAIPLSPEKEWQVAISERDQEDEQAQAPFPADLPSYRQARWNDPDGAPPIMAGGSGPIRFRRLRDLHDARKRRAAGGVA